MIGSVAPQLCTVEPFADDLVHVPPLNHITPGARVILLRKAGARRNDVRCSGTRNVVVVQLPYQIPGSNLSNHVTLNNVSRSSYKCASSQFIRARNNPSRANGMPHLRTGTASVVYCARVGVGTSLIPFLWFRPPRSVASVRALWRHARDRLNEAELTMNQNQWPISLTTMRCYSCKETYWRIRALII